MTETETTPGIATPAAEYLDKLTPSVGPGPFYGFCLVFPGAGRAVDPASPGALRLRGRVLDGAGRPVPAPDVLIEFLQGNQFARAMADDDGDFEVVLAKPAVGSGAPFFHVRLFVFPVTEPFETRLYFPDETTANGTDEVLAALDPADRPSLVAQPDGDGLRWEIHTAGNHQTAFFVPIGDASMIDTRAVRARPVNGGTHA
jgi:protocatechuate 3,4-dioxygenase alpha subunit